MAITWMGDTGGYFGGRLFGGKLFGGRKLAPTISPKKTREGAVFGLLMSILGGFTLNAVYRDIAGVGPIASPGVLLVAGLFGGIFEQLGDLLESLFKRFAGVKDSGSIIPGHGGLLDRVDGILFAAPVIWAVIYYGGALGL
jgi:phosphatidate cytidylyltransferase